MLCLINEHESMEGCVDYFESRKLGDAIILSFNPIRTRKLRFRIIVVAFSILKKIKRERWKIYTLESRWKFENLVSFQIIR